MKLITCIFFIAILLITASGFAVIIEKLDILEAGQIQIAGFLLVPAGNHPGPIMSIRDIGKVK